MLMPMSCGAPNLVSLSLSQERGEKDKQAVLRLRPRLPLGPISPPLSLCCTVVPLCPRLYLVFRSNQLDVTVQLLGRFMGPSSAQHTQAHRPPTKALPAVPPAVHRFSQGHPPPLSQQASGLPPSLYLCSLSPSPPSLSTAKQATTQQAVQACPTPT